MRVRLLTIAAAAWALAWTAVVVAQQAAAPAGGQESTPVFRGGVELMSLSVSVSDKRGRPITDLTQDEFVIFEDRQPQTIVSFTSAKQKNSTPVGLGLVLDASQSMTRERLEAMRTGVQIVVNGRLRKDDELYFVEFASDVRLTVPWTTNKNEVIAAIRRIQPRTGTALYDAIRRALDVSRAGRHKKQVMLIVTDGGDTHSTVNRQELAMLARASGVILYGLVVDTEGGFGARAGGDYKVRQSAAELAQMTEITGGRTEYVQGFAELENAIEQMGQEFTQQYELAYPRRPDDGRFHEIIVGVKRTDIIVRHRIAYLAGPLPPPAPPAPPAKP